MIKIAGITKISIATIGGTIAYFLGGMDDLLKVLIFFMVLDYCSGVIKAFYKKGLSSNIGFQGIAKKVLTLMVIAVAFSIEELVNYVFPLREIVIMFFIANDGLSILEHAAEIGVPIPKSLREALGIMQKKDEEV